FAQTLPATLSFTVSIHDALPIYRILDEYLTNVREVEQQLDRMAARSGSIEEEAAAPLGIPESFDEHLTITYDLMRLAFQGDISRDRKRTRLNSSHVKISYAVFIL